MPTALNWKDFAGGSEAHASRAVGGRYRVERQQGLDFLGRPNGASWFDVRRLVNTGPGAWNNPPVFSKDPPRTLEAAKAVAEADNAKLAASRTASSTNNGSSGER